MLTSNYLVQFPVQYYGLSEILTYGAFTYPMAFLITDLANRSFGKEIAKKIVYFGFFIGISFTLFFSTNFSDLISIRITIGSGTAFIVSQRLDVYVFDKLRKKKLVHTPFSIFNKWFSDRYFLVLLNCILCNWSILVYPSSWRFSS